jgi:hypothetical protein
MGLAGDEAPAGFLELRENRGEAQYFLAGWPLTTGAQVEILLADERWLRGIFEWNGERHRWPGLRLWLGGQEPGARPVSLVAAIHPSSIVRWLRS